MAEQFVNSIIGHGSLFRGDIEIDGLVRIDGDYIGNVKKAQRVLVGNQGRADATINADIVVIGGAFHGTIYAHERAVILSTALVVGMVNSPMILVEPGALLSCALCIGTNDEREPQDFTHYKIKKPQSKNVPRDNSIPLVKGTVKNKNLVKRS
jgi:cytoskeletal protein CcmA (bactofilin family)